MVEVNGGGTRLSLTPEGVCFRFGVAGVGVDEVGFERGTLPRVSRPGGEATGEQAEQGGVGTGGGEMDADAGSLFDDAGADFE